MLPNDTGMKALTGGAAAVNNNKEHTAVVVAAVSGKRYFKPIYRTIVPGAIICYNLKEYNLNQLKITKDKSTSYS